MNNKAKKNLFLFLKVIINKIIYQIESNKIAHKKTILIIYENNYLIKNYFINI